MPDESDVVPGSRIVRWIAMGALIAFALGLYFRDGRRLPPLTAPAGRQIGGGGVGEGSGGEDMSGLEGVRLVDARQRATV